MLELQIPDYASIKITKIVFDLNGTLACDGQLIAGVKDKLNRLDEDYEVYVLTADTFGTAEETFAGFNGEVVIIDSEDGSSFKRNFVEKLGSNQVIAVGNGRNDGSMLAEAVIGISVLGPEGTATSSLLKSDVIVRNINQVFEIILNPKRLVATLRK